MKLRWVFIWVAVVIIQFALNINEATARRAKDRLSQDEDIQSIRVDEDRLEKEKCEIYKEIYKHKSKRSVRHFDCSQKGYLHFFKPPPKSYKPTNSALKIAAFNALHFGDNVARFKNVSYVAKMLKSWDVVAVMELMTLPMSGKPYKNNLEIIKKANLLVGEIDEERNDSRKTTLINDLNITVGNLVLPGYLQLLLELRQIDPRSHWSLILTPQSLGSSAMHQELIGVYYKAKQVSFQQTDYCKNRRLGKACVMPLPEHREDFVERAPFITSFVKKNFDFTLVTTHVRFGPPGDDVLGDAIEYIHGDTPKIFKKLKRDVNARLAEIKVISTEINELANSSAEKDIIVAGDFNVPADQEKFMNAWEETLKVWPGSEVFQFEPTTLSATSGLVSNYDHFLADPILTKECGLDRAKVYDFSELFGSKTSLKGWKKEAQEYFADIRDSVNSSTFAEKFNFQSDYKTIRSFLGLSFNDYYNRTDIKTGELLFNSGDFRETIRLFIERVIEPMSSDEKPYKAAIQSFSDHLPIYMSCKVTEEDDD